MNPGFQAIINASAIDRGGLFAETAQRLGTAPGNVEKDFWVCWTLDALFNALPKPPRKLFKGGTALAKAFDLIKRFSEDIDIAIFRGDLGHDVGARQLIDLSKGRRAKRLEKIQAACRRYMAETFMPGLEGIVAAAMREASIPVEGFSVSLDPDDPDQQSVLFRYPAVHRESTYIATVVKIESGARSALDPHTDRVIRPYVEQEAKVDLRVAGVTSMLPERTFWDKIVILHGLRRSYDNTRRLKRDGERVSRHYFDLHSLLKAPEAAVWVKNDVLPRDCALHAELFFGSATSMLQEAKRGTYALSPAPEMAKLLATDYGRMAGMVFGDVPPFDEVLAAVRQLEERLNS